MVDIGNLKELENMWQKLLETLNNQDDSKSRKQFIRMFNNDKESEYITPSFDFLKKEGYFKQNATLLKLLKSLKQASEYKNITETVNNIVNNIGKLEKEEEEREEKEFTELVNAFKFLNKYVKSNALDLMKNDVNFQDIKNRLNKGFEGLEDADGFKERVKKDMELFNAVAYNKFKQVKKSKDMKYSPLYVGLTNYATNVKLIFSIFKYPGVEECSDYMNKWQERAEKYSKNSKQYRRVERKVKWLKDKTENLNTGLQGFKTYLKNLIKLCEFLEKKEEMFNNFLKFKKLNEDLTNNIMQLTESLNNISLKEGEKLSDEDEIEKDLSSLEALFKSLNKYTERLQTRLVNITTKLDKATGASVENLKDSERLNLRLELVEDLKELLNELKEITKEAKSMGFKFKGLNDLYKKKLQDLILKFGKSESTEFVENGVEMINADLKNQSKRIDTLIKHRISIERILGKAKNLEDRLMSKQVTDEVIKWEPVKKLDNKLQGLI